MKALAIITLVFLNITSIASATPDSLFIKCTAQEHVPSQPCGGQNAKDLKFYVSLDGAFPESGFKLNQSYGGCYPISDSTFGTLEHVQVRGSIVTFNFKTRGSFSIGDIPTLNASSDDNELTPATFDMNSNRLTLDVRNTFWPYQAPRVLTCSSLFE